MGHICGRAEDAPKSKDAMQCIEVLACKRALPTGDPRFVTMQAFPAAIRAEQADPFLLCDEFGPTVSDGRVENPDAFPTNWHPHIGMDILTYLKEGVGRHADSLGNRSEFASPGFQWVSAGSGIMHAEGGGTPEGAAEHGFQIWVNVPQSRKGDDPRYGTEPPENVPVLQLSGGGLARVVAGALGDLHGPFRTAQPVQIVDFELTPGAAHTHRVPLGLDNAMFFAYKGSGHVASWYVRAQRVARLVADDPALRSLDIRAGSEGLRGLLFAGKRINEPIVWQGPFVMNSKQEVAAAFRLFQSDDFPAKRAPWDYTKLADFPPERRGAALSDVAGALSSQHS